MWPNLHTPTMNCNLIFYKNQIGKILSFYVSAVKEKVSGFDEAWQVERRGGAGRPGEKILEMWSLVRIRISPGTGAGTMLGNLELETDGPTEPRG